jgi:hypothetical protein
MPPVTAARSGGAIGGGGGGGGGGVVSTCQPLPGTCVLIAKLQGAGKIAVTGQIRFERSPTGIRVTGTLQPNGLGTAARSYYAIALDSPSGSPIVGYAARGEFDLFASPLTQTVTFESLPGDGLLSHTPNVNPVSPSYIQLLQNFGGQQNMFLVDSSAPSPAVLALFAAVHAGSSVHFATLADPCAFGTVPCSPVGTPYVPIAFVWDMAPIGTLQ